MPKSSFFRDRFTFLFLLDVVASVNSEEKFVLTMSLLTNIWVFDGFLSRIYIRSTDILLCMYNISQSFSREELILVIKKWLYCSLKGFQCFFVFVSG